MHEVLTSGNFTDFSSSKSGGKKKQNKTSEWGKYVEGGESFQC